MHMITSDFFWCRNLKVLPCGQFHTPGWVEIDGCLSSYRSSWWSCTCAIWCDHWSCLGWQIQGQLFFWASRVTSLSHLLITKKSLFVVFLGMRMHFVHQKVWGNSFLFGPSKVAICTTCWTSWSPCAWIGDILWPIGSWWKGYHLTGGGGNSWTPW